MPSIWTRISVFTRRLASCSPAAPRELQRLSISSINIVLGAIARAISKRQRTMRSDSPLHRRFNANHRHLRKRDYRYTADNDPAAAVVLTGILTPGWTSSH